MNSEEIDSYIKAGEIAKKVKKFARDLIKPGMKLIDIANAIDSKIYELGAEPAFPCGLSIDEIAAHYTPVPGDETVASGLLCVDIGVTIDGYIADTAFSMDLSEEKEHIETIRLNEKILEEISKVIKPGAKVCDIGEAAMRTLEEYNKEKETNFSIVSGLCGHKLGHHIIHDGLTIPNTRNSNTRELKNIAIAVEPFVTKGTGEIYEGKPGGILVLKRDGVVRDRDAREVLEYIKEKFKTRPFCRRFLEDKGFKKLGYVLSTLEKQGIIYHYPELLEKTKQAVSQTENTFIIKEDEVVISTS